MTSIQPSLGRVTGEPSTTDAQQAYLLSLPQGGDTGVTSAHADREARLAADAATMTAGPVEHAASMTSHHQGSPSAEQQMITHGAPAPRTPDTGGRTGAGAIG